MNKTILSVIVLSLFAVAILSSCGSKYNKLKFHDPNEGSTEIYGNIGGEPLTVETPTKPDAVIGAITKEAAPKFREHIEAGIQK